MSNLLVAIKNIVQCKSFQLHEILKSHNRINNVGEALEEFIKDSFAGTYDYDEIERMDEQSQVFSYLGNQNNPPDIILKNGDAIEVKKVESASASLALNSSYPKAKLYRDSTMLNKACKECDGGVWEEKDIIYTVGVVNDDTLKHIFFCYGEDYAADNETYEKIKKQIKEGILTIPDIEFADSTNELGRVNRVDPLGITYLRIRGMWHIESPFKVFSYIHSLDKEKDFTLTAIINKNKYNSFPEEDRKAFEAVKGISITDSKIKDPNNPANRKDVKVIIFAK